MASAAEPAAAEERPAEQVAAPGIGEEQPAPHASEETPGERRESPASEAVVAPRASPRRPESPLDDIQMADYDGGEWAPWVTPQGSPRGLQDEREEDDDDMTQLARRLAESAERAQVSEIHQCYPVLHVPAALYLERPCWRQRARAEEVRLLREELAQSQRSLVLANQLRERTADDLVALRDQVRQLTEERDRLAAERARGDAASAAELERARATLKEERRQFVAERARLVEDMRQAALEEGRRAGLE